MTLYDIKPRFQALLRPLVVAAWRRGVTANAVTIAALAGSLALGALLAIAGRGAPVLYLLLPVWLVVRMALNAVDGMLAREHGQKSHLGAYLNELADVAADAALMLPFALLPGPSPVLVVIVVVLAGLSEFAGALGPMIGASRRYEGPLGKSDRALLFGALGLWLGLARDLPAWSNVVLLAAAALLLVTIVNRVRSGIREAGGAPRVASTL